MATDQVLNWLGGATTPPGQQPLRLSKQIESFEQDFSNGYLYGEILSQYGICESVNTFSKKSNKEAKVHNFYQIEDALRYLKVPFDAKLIHQIMNEEVGASMRLLYQMKISLDRYLSKNDMTVTGLKQKTIDNKVKKVQDLSHKLPAIHKQYGVSGPTIKGTNFRNIEKKLLKYEVARVNLEKKAYEDELSDKNMLQSIQQSKRQEAHRKLEENKHFMNEWTKEGIQNWKQNREIRSKEIARQLYFEDREVKMYKDALYKELDSHTKDLIDGVEEFQENMTKLGVEQNITIQEAQKRQEEKAGIPPGQIQNFSYAATMNKIKETKNNNEFAGKERERRNRKMQVDQKKIQERLDAKKTEENLISKLLAKQSQEQNQAYTRLRQAHCSKIVVTNRVAVADRMQTEKEERNAKISAQMKKDAEDVEEGRQESHGQNKYTIKQNRREEKAKRRRVNVEIASELIDLIMDVANEAHEFQGNDNKKLSKDTWRTWMKVFGQGKKVSEINLVIEEEKPDDSQGRELESIALLSQKGPVNPTRLLAEIKNEPIYDDFLQYITMCGAQNLRLVAPDKWHTLSQLLQSDEKLKHLNADDYGFLNDFYLPKNAELGTMLQNLYDGKVFEENLMGQTLGSGALNLTTGTLNSQQMNLTKSKMEAAEFIPDFPVHHTLKLCLLGKAYSGKKTQAQMIVDEYGLNLFNMSEILREALAYVQKPEAKDEAADPKAAKGGKPAKGEPAQAADSFAGLDTTQYKEIAAKLLSQIQIASGNSEALPGNEVDIVAMVQDDGLLVNLFTQKLKLTFPNPSKSKEEVESGMRQNLVKEKELLEQLEEAKQNEGVDADPKAKKGAKAVKTPADIQSEIDALLRPEVNGWVLIDFPRNINQAKLMENAFTGYTSVTDVPKAFEKANFEVWTKLVDPECSTKPDYTGEIESQHSLFDAVFMLSISKAECFRRAQGRQVDSQTGTVYHKEDSPAPENDPKLAERLSSYFGAYQTEEDMINKMDQNHMQSTDNEAHLRNFFFEFGAFDKIAKKGNPTLKDFVSEEKLDKADLNSEMNERIDAIFKFKQIEQDRRYAEVRARIQEEEEEKARAEEAANNSQAAGTPKEEQEQAKIEDLDAVPDQAEGSKRKPIEKTHSQLSLGSQQSGAVQESISKNSLGNTASRRGVKRQEYTREYKVKLWEQMVLSYIKDGMYTMTEIKSQNERVTESLNNSQSTFIQYLERTDDKQVKVNEFVQSFNKFSDEFPDLRKDEQTKEELMNRVQTFSDQLWEIIEKKKDESLLEISRQAKGGWSDTEMKQTCRNMANLVELEIKKFSAVYQMIMQQEPPVELDAEIMTKKIIERGVQPYDDQKCNSPVLNQVMSSLLSKLDELLSKHGVPEKQFNADYYTQVLRQEKEIFVYRLTMINAWGLAILEEIHSHSRQVYECLDDWVVDAVAQENQICNHVLGILRESIKSETLKLDDYQCLLPTLSLYDKIEQIPFSTSTKPRYLQNIHVPTDDLEASRFDMEHLNEIYKELRFNVAERGSMNTLDHQSFVNIMVIAVRQGRVPLVWKYCNFEVISQWAGLFAVKPLEGANANNDQPTQYQSQLNQSITKQMFGKDKRHWVNWKSIVTFFALTSSNLPSDAELASYRVALTDAGKDQRVSLAEFLQVATWFDKSEGKPDRKLLATWQEEKQRNQLSSDYESDEDEEDLEDRLDSGRLQAVKTILFNTHRVNTGEDYLEIPQFIDALIHMVSSVGGQEQTFGDRLLR